MRRRMMMGGRIAVNLWNMSLANIGVPGYSEATKVITADGKLTVTNISGVDSARIMASMTLEQLGLAIGDTCTIKVWSDNFGVTNTKMSYIRVNNEYPLVLIYPTSRDYIYERTFTITDDFPIYVGNLYSEDYSVNSTTSVKVELYKL